MQHVMTIKAFQRKPELGGGFVAVARVRPEGVALGLREERVEADSLDKARYEAQMIAHRQLAGRPYQRSALARRFVGNQYVANIWI